MEFKTIHRQLKIVYFRSVLGGITAHKRESKNQTMVNRNINKEKGRIR